MYMDVQHRSILHKYVYICYRIQKLRYTMPWYLLSTVVVAAVDVALDMEASDNAGRLSDEETPLSGEERLSDEDAATVEVFNTVVFTIVVFKRLINPGPLRLMSGLVVVPNTLIASVTENFEAIVLGMLGAAVTTLLADILLMAFGGVLLAMTTVFGAPVMAVFGITLLMVFEATGRVVMGLVAFGNGFNTRLLVAGTKGDDA